ncbi:MAG TPA: hypothetical protein VGC35_10600 [Allosphingosinicella sp.]|jgi:hypothetical protein
MAILQQLSRWAAYKTPLPPLSADVHLVLVPDEKSGAVQEPVDPAPQPISAFACIIDYAGEARFITCRRYDLIGPVGYVGAICHSAGGYRQFRCDRIESVSDASTGETLGDGSYFSRFAVTSERDAAATWGLSHSRRATLIAGLNVMAFMARCDGHWHELETEVVERFVCSMWLRKDWEGDPPMLEILAHAQRLAPDAETFMKSLRCYANSTTSTQILKRMVSDLIAADGVICANEMNWGAELEAFFRDYREDEFDRSLAIIVQHPG